MTGCLKPLRSKPAGRDNSFPAYKDYNSQNFQLLIKYLIEMSDKGGYCDIYEGTA